MPRQESGNSNMLNIAMQMAQNNSAQQQGLFQLLLERMKDENNELRHALGNQDPLGEISRTANALKSLGVFGQTMPPDVQLKMKEIEHQHEMERIRIESEQNAQANFANTMATLGKEAMNSEWLGDVLTSLSNLAANSAQDKIQQQQQQHQLPVDFQYSQPPAPAYYAPQEQPQPVQQKLTPEEQNEFNNLVSQLQQEIMGQQPDMQKNIHPPPQKEVFEEQQIMVDQDPYIGTDENGYDVLDLGKIMSPDFGKRKEEK